MADFSKEFCENYDPDMPYDFSIEEVFKDLKPGYYTSYICEGYGFVAISKTEEGVCQVAFPIPYEEGDEQMVKWVPFNQVTKDTYKTIK